MAQAQSAGRGLLLITAAKIYFMVGASALGLVLPHLLPSQVAYGEWGFVLSMVSPFNNVMVTATIQMVSKWVSRGPQWANGTKRTALLMQLVVAGLVGLGYFLAAPWIAQIEKDPTVVPALRLSTGVMVCYAFYSVFVGAANGAREFHKQAGLDMTFTTLRTVLVCGAAVALHSVFAAVGGFVAAAAVVLVISIAVVGLPRGSADDDDEEPVAAEMARFMAPVAAYLLLLNFLMFVDGYVVKRLVAEAALGGAAGAIAAAEEASRKLAVYTAAQLIARIPYQAILSVTFVIFPLVSASTFAADREKTKGYVEKSIRLSFLVVTAMAAAVAARPDGLLSLFPRGEYLVGGPALAVLVFGYVAFSLLSIAGTIMNGAGSTTTTTLLALGTLVLDAGLSWALVSHALATGGDPLVAAATGTTVAMTLGTVASLVFLQRRYGASLPLSSVARAGIGVAVAYAVGRVIPLHGVLAIGAAVAAGVAYLVTLVITREVTAGEVRALLRR